MDQEIDVSTLTPSDAAELRALFESAAGASRQGDRPAQESFLLGLAALVDGLMKASAKATGEPIPAPIDMAAGSADSVDLADLTAADAAIGARFLLDAGQAFADKGMEALGVALGGLALAFGKAARLKGSQGPHGASPAQQVN